MFAFWWNELVSDTKCCSRLKRIQYFLKNYSFDKDLIFKNKEKLSA